MYTNAQSILSKLGELSAMAVDSNPDLILISESWCNGTISDAMLSVPGYELKSELRKDRCDTAQGIGGGLLVYAKEGLKVIQCDSSKNFNQYCKFRLICDTVPLTFYLVYRPPTSSSDNMTALAEILSQVEPNAFLIGDFNLPGVNWDSYTATGRAAEVAEAAADSHLEQLVQFPTHTKGNTLDLVLSNNPDLVYEIADTGRIGKSDHCILMVTIMVEPSFQQEDSIVQDWRKADWDRIRQELGSTDWDKELTNLDIEAAWKKFSSKVTASIDLHTPTKKRRSRRRPPWLSREIMRAINRKKRFWKAAKKGERVAEYKEAEKQVKNKIRAAKRNYERKLARDSNNPKPFYAHLKRSTKSKQSIGPLRNERGEPVQEEGEMASLLNQFFCSVFTQNSNLPPPHVPAKHVKHPMAQISVTRRVIEEKIQKLKPESAPGPDNIRPRQLQELKKIISKPLQILFEKSLREKKIPTAWKSANITPIFKKGTKSSPGNYRPVALTSVCCKLLENIIKDDLAAHLERNALLRPSQHGFLARKSCTTNLLEFFEPVTASADNNVCMDLVFLDLAKAFDKVPMDLLVHKLRAYGIDSSTADWIEDWLSNRRQRVVIAGSNSEWGDVESGVIQGSVLGPILFDVYIDDLDEVVRMITLIKKFADDTKLGQTIKSPEDRAKLQEALDGVDNWARQWGMEFNHSKCKVMHLGRNNPQHEYQMGGQKLEATTQEKDIGVIVQNNLKPGAQCAAAATKARQVLGQIARSFSYRNADTFVRLYKLYVRPHLEFASPAWAPWYAGDIELLERVQMKAVKMVSGLRGRTYEERLVELDMVTLKQRRVETDMAQVHKIVHGIDRVEAKTWFKFSHNENERSTRATTDPTHLSSAVFRTDIRKNFFSVRTINGWNKIPAEIREIPLSWRFKKRLREHYKSSASA